MPWPSSPRWRGRDASPRFRRPWRIRKVRHWNKTSQPEGRTIDEGGRELDPGSAAGADAVQKDLGLTADQTAEIIEFVKVARERSREFVAKWPDLSDSRSVPVVMSEARTRELQAWIEAWQSKQKEWRAKVVGMLTPSQSERLKQIQLQHALAGRPRPPDLIKALDISAEQLARIRPLSDRVDERQLAALHDLDGLTREERRKKAIELSTELDKAQAEANMLATGVLTPEQRVKLEKFTGKEIEVTWDYDALVPDDGMW